MTETSNHKPTRQTRSQEAWRAMTQPETPATALKLAAGQALVTSINRQAREIAAARTKQEITQ